MTVPIVNIWTARQRQTGVANLSMARGCGSLFAPESIWELLSHDFDAVIDVRSPGEFAVDHIDAAMNLPVLDDDERRQVGTTYVQDSKFQARRLGASLIASNIAHHLDTNLADCVSNWRPLIYCWRGGQRSQSFAEICRQVGWRVSTLAGGYKHYRQLVNAFFYRDPMPFQPVLLAGPTGTGKTAILAELAKAGAQTLDLEHCARHKGSVFGQGRLDQPTQKGFESRLITRLRRVDTAGPLFLEAESNRIGQISLPPSLWSAMRDAPRIQITAPIESRTDFIVRTYHRVTSDMQGLRDRIACLAPFHSAAQIAHWHSLAASSSWHALVRDLMEHHYDPLYRKSTQQATATTPVTITLTDHSQVSIEAAAREIAARLSEIA